MSQDTPLILLPEYLSMTVVNYDGKLYTQNDGACIGSCITAILSDLDLAPCD